MPETIQIEGKTLTLNGLGLRKKAIIKLYVAGLYLEAASKDATAIVAADTPRAIRMQFLRGLGKGQLVSAFREGFEKNAPEKAAAQKAAVERFLGLVADVKQGDVVSYTYVPGKGTIIASGDREIGTIAGKEFADALFLIWLGPKPPSDDLKRGMLG